MGHRRNRPGRSRLGRVLSDAVIAWLHPSEARDLCGLGPDAELPLGHPVLRAHLTIALTVTELASTSGSRGPSHDSS